MTWTRTSWIYVTLAAAVTGVAVSNLPFMGPSGELDGAGSALASKISFSIGAAFAIAFLVLCVLELATRLRSDVRAREDVLR